MTRPHIALTGALFALLALPAASADAVWSEKEQVKSFTSERALKVAVEDTGTIDLGIATGGGGLGPGPGSGSFYVSRTLAASGWSGTGVTITKITAAPPTGVWALSSSGAALVTWSQGSPAKTFAAFKPAGGAWGATTLLDSTASTTFDAPIPVIDEKGDAAVVWARKSEGATHVLNAPNQVVVSVPGPGGAWPLEPTKLADITTPEPQIPSSPPGSGYKYSGCPTDLRAAILSDGTPVAAWSDDYGSWKQTGALDPEFEIALCGVRASSGSGTVDITPRPAVGRLAAPAGGMPSWRLLELASSPTDSKSAIELRGLESSIVTGGSCTETNACVNQQRETQMRLGTGSAFGSANSLGMSVGAFFALRNGRIAVAADGSTMVLSAGVGATFPNLTALPLDPTTIAAAAALNDAGAAHLAVVPDQISAFGLYMFDAPAAGAFGSPQQLDTSGGVRLTPSIATDCTGKAVVAWARTSPAGQLYTSMLDGLPSACESGPGPGPGPGPGGGSSTPPTTGTGTGTTIVSTPPPSPATLAALASPKLDPNGSKVRFEIVCAPVTVNACGGKVVITQSNGGKARVAAKKATVLGSVSFSGLAPGASRRLKVPLVKSAKQALQAGKTIKAVITATVHDGNGLSRVTSKAATLRLPAR
ncbi:MAG TPA: hypothetical protein VLL27_07490 [Solirubrobacterales bacterium]|nr:hypothetical protein [Solirubrobacterales bacterium]